MGALGRHVPRAFLSLLVREQQTKRGPPKRPRGLDWSSGLGFGLVLSSCPSRSQLGHASLLLLVQCGQLGIHLPGDHLVLEEVQGLDKVGLGHLHFANIGLNAILLILPEDQGLNIRVECACGRVAILPARQTWDALAQRGIGHQIEKLETRLRCLKCKRRGHCRVGEYPEDYIGLIEAVHVDVENELEEFEQRAPSEAPQNIFREWNRGSIAFVNGRAVPPRRLGSACEMGIAEDPQGGYWSMGSAAPWTGDADVAVGMRLDWITRNVRGGHTIWWCRRDTGDGILLDDYDYFVVFHAPADDAAFLAAFPGAGA